MAILSLDSIVSSPSTRLLTDSRSLTSPADTVFVALSTSSNDGHRYIHQLIDKGVSRFIVNHIPADIDPSSADFCIVPDTLEALHTLAMNRRRQLRGTVVAITGSRGKTVVKEWLFTLLRMAGVRLWRSPRSFNSRTGVPLSIWEADADADILIFEAGISKAGEMSLLQNLLRPQVGVLTNILDDHDEGFSSREQKCLEKLSLFSHSDPIVCHIDIPIVAQSVQDAGLMEHVLGISRSDLPGCLVLRDSTSRPDGTVLLSLRYRDVDFEIQSPFSAPHDIQNLLTVCGAMLALGFTPDQFVHNVSALRHIDTRITVVDGINGSVVISDPFTSDLPSLVGVLDFARRRRTDDRPLIAVLGDDAATIDGVFRPDRLRELLHTHGVDKLIGVGASLSAAAAGFSPRDIFYPDVDSLLRGLPGVISSNAVVAVAGTPAGERIIEHIEARRHETVLEVSLDALAHNFNTFKSLVPPSTGIICMVKASGYGAGAEETAKTLQAQGASYVAVAVCDEGMALRRAGLTMPVMVMNPRSDNYFAMFGAMLEPEIYSFELLDDIIRAAERAGEHLYPLHIKIDTGMHRLGFTPDELQEVARRINASPAVRAASVFSHLATADCPDQDDYTEMQLSLFDRASTEFLAMFDYPVRRHILNSAGIIRYGRTRYAYDMVRLGISLYGICTIPQSRSLGLKPVSSLHTSIISLRSYPAGSSVGYGRRGHLDRDSVIATLPVGYADGLNRHLGNGALRVALNGHRCPIVGNICMDACMVDVTGVPCSVGDRVELFGTTVTPDELAALLDTIPYEVLTSVSERVRRVYFRD